jgi:phospho-N-acetylmuramoyl-pentapeptide-transferase
MLAELLYDLHDHFSAFRVFRYITFRAAYAAMTAFLLTIALGPWMIARLRAAGAVKHVRHEGPQSHQLKSGTPTMGGLLILAGTTIPTVLWSDPRIREVGVALGVTLALGALGFLDDYLQTIRGQNRGLVGRAKIVGQVAVGLVAGIAVLGMVPREAATATTVPFLKTRMIDLGWLYIPFVVFVLTGASNAVNLTDGLDGLAIGVTVFAALTSLSAVPVTEFADYLQIPWPAAGEAKLTRSSLLGASLGFLWYNSHPAQLFMGDTGSLALGGALGIVAVLLKMEIVFAIVGGVFVAEALSVILQVGSFRLTGRRIFRMAPIHHHFELMGWPENKVVVRFWIVAGLCALLSLSTLKLR